MKDVRSICATFIGSAPVEKVAILHGKNAYAHDGNAVLELKNVLELYYEEPVRVNLSDMSETKTQASSVKMPPRVVYESEYDLKNFLHVLQEVKLKVFPELTATFNILKGSVFVDAGEKMFGVKYPCLDGFDWKPFGIQYVSVAHTRKVMEKLGVEDVKLLVGYFGACFDTEKFAVHAPIKALRLEKWRLIREATVEAPFELSSLTEATLRCDGRWLYLNKVKCGECDTPFRARFDIEDARKLEGERLLLKLYVDSAWLVSKRTYIGTRRIEFHGW